MFSQWRQAVETFAQSTQGQHSPKPSQDASAARSSTDSLRQTTSSGQLADSTKSSLKKSIANQRSSSPAPRASVSDQGAGRSPGHRTTLEDRLRAKFTIGDATTSTTPSGSSKPSRAPTPVTDHPLSPSPSPRPTSPDIDQADFEHPLSPTSIPLPQSPVLISADHSTESLPPERVTFPLNTEVAVLETQNEDAQKHMASVDSAQVEKSVAEEPPASDTHNTGSVREIQDHVHNEDANRGKFDDVEEEGVTLVPGLTAVAEETSVAVSVPDTQTIVVETASPSPVSEDVTVENNEKDEVKETPALDVSSETTYQTDNSNTVRRSSIGHADTGVTVAVTTGELATSPVQPSSPSRGDEPDIDALQRRLKLVEQRFTGMCNLGVVDRRSLIWNYRRFYVVQIGRAHV